MLISPTFKACFIHCPKTGGTSIQQYFRENDPLTVFCKDHIRASDAQWIFEGKYSSWYRFGTCRHPYGVLASHYRQILREPHHRYFGIVVGPDRNAANPRMKFGDWLRWQTEERFPVGPSHYLDAPMTRILRFERLSEDFAVLAGELKLPKLELPHVNNSVESWRWEDYITDGDKEYIRRWYDDDFRRFGYVAD